MKERKNENTKMVRWRKKKKKAKKKKTQIS